MSVAESTQRVRDTDIMRAYPLYALAMLMLILNVNDLLFATGRGMIAPIVSLVGVIAVTLPLAFSLALD